MRYNLKLGAACGGEVTCCPVDGAISPPGSREHPPEGPNHF